ncbi:MAG: preprotein translocase subunit SecE [Planctomycetaceae bacterium]|nr:preprotein translocase subunit SecE [Planctomycetaceae bacterium]
MAGPRAGFFERLATFWHDVRAELRRVTWPSAKDVQGTTIITIIAVAFFAAYLFAVDKVLTFLVNQLTRVLS